MNYLNLKIRLMTWAILSMMVLGCETDDEASSVSASEEVAATNAIATASGSWRISSYIDDGVNETSDYNGYNFTFDENGVVVATNGTTTYEGTWSVSRDSDSSSDDDDGVSNDDLEFTIFFNVSDDNDFEDLNDDWDIISANADTIALIDISGGDGSTDRLTFQKN